MAHIFVVHGVHSLVWACCQLVGSSENSSTPLLDAVRARRLCFFGTNFSQNHRCALPASIFWPAVSTGRGDWPGYIPLRKTFIINLALAYTYRRAENRSSWRSLVEMATSLRCPGWGIVVIIIITSFIEVINVYYIFTYINVILLQLVEVSSATLVYLVAHVPTVMLSVFLEFVFVTRTSLRRTRDAVSIVHTLLLKPGFHYPSWRPELTGDRFLLPVNTVLTGVRFH